MSEKVALGPQPGDLDNIPKDNLTSFKFKLEETGVDHDPNRRGRGKIVEVQGPVILDGQPGP